MLHVAHDAAEWFHVVAKAVAEPPAQENHGRDIDGGAEDIAGQEGPRAEPERAREGAGGEAEARDEARHEDRQRAPPLDEALHRPEPLGVAENPVGVAHERAAAEAAAGPVAQVIPDYRAHDAHGQDEIQAHLPAPHQEARNYQHRLLWNGDPRIAQNHERKDGGVAPVRNGRARVQRNRLGGEPARELGHAGTDLRGMTLMCPSSSRMA